MNLNKQKDPAQKDIKFILSLLSSGKFTEAGKEANSQIINFPNSSILFNMLGAIHAGQNQFEKAIENYEKAIKINSNYAQAYNNLGITLQKLKKTTLAINNYRKAIDLKNDFPEALNNLGNATWELNKSKDCLVYFEKAIKINSNYTDAFNSLGSIYYDLGDNQAAISNYQKAIKINPNYTEAHYNLGMLFHNLARFDESLSSYNEAIKLNPNDEKIYNNLGNLLNDLGKHEEAMVAYKKAIQLKPDYAKAYSNHIFNFNYINNFDQNLYLSEAKKFGIDCKKIKKNLPVRYQYEKEPKKIRLGLVSSDFGNHPGGHFTLSTLRELRKKNFELIAYSNWDRNDEISHYFKPLFSKWHSIEKKSDDEVVEQIFNDGIHILLELQGHSAKNRITIFMHKPAPIQVSWLSTGTLGVSEIDYLIGSPHIIPKNEEKYFIEKIWRLPEITQCFTPPDFDLEIKELPFSRNNFITFGSVNKLSKINDDVIALWSKILLSVPNSKIILKNKNFNNQKIKETTLERFEKYKIRKNCLILKGESATRKELLEVYNEIDIALDPFPFQGNTSTCEAVWMGVPVLTLKGNSTVFHFGESINANLNMYDWIAKNRDEYISKAIKFSSDIDLLSRIRKNLRKTALLSPVFDAPRFAKHFSQMLWEMWKNFKKLQKRP